MTTSAQALPSRTASKIRWINEPLPAPVAPSKGLMDKFREEVDPGGLLPDDEREQRADLLLRAHMTRMSSVRARYRASRRS